MIKTFFSLNQRSLFLIHDPVGVKLLTRLRLQSSHLNEHKFRHNFKTAWVPCVIVVLKQKQPVTFSYVANFFVKEKQKLRDDVYRLDTSIKHLNEDSLIDVYYMVQIDLTTVNTFSYNLLYSSYQIFWKTTYWPVLIFVQLLPLCFYLEYLLKLYLQCNVLFYYFNLFTDFSLSKGCIGDISAIMCSTSP